MVIRKERSFSYRKKSLFWSLPKTGFVKETGGNCQNEAPKEAPNRFLEPLSLAGGPGLSSRRLQEAPKSNLEPTPHPKVNKRKRRKVESVRAELSFDTFLFVFRVIVVSFGMGRFTQM